MTKRATFGFGISSDGDEPVAVVSQPCSFETECEDPLAWLCVATGDIFGEESVNRTFSFAHLDETSLDQTITIYKEPHTEVASVTEHRKHR